MFERKGEKMGEKVISAKDLPWIKSPRFKEEVSDVMSVLTSERFICFDFGSFDYEGREAGTLEPTKPYINYHTRIKVSYEHFKEIVKLLNEILRKEEEKRRKIE
jgi:hypothetical protein